MKNLQFGAAISADAIEAWGARAIVVAGRPLEYVWNRRDQWSDVTNSTEVSAAFKQHFDACTAWFETQWRKKIYESTKNIKTPDGVFSCWYRCYGGYAHVSISRMPAKPAPKSAPKSAAKPKRVRRARPA